MQHLAHLEDNYHQNQSKYICLSVCVYRGSESLCGGVWNQPLIRVSSGRHYFSACDCSRNRADPKLCGICNSDTIIYWRSRFLPFRDRGIVHGSRSGTHCIVQGQPRSAGKRKSDRDFVCDCCDVRDFSSNSYVKYLRKHNGSTILIAFL